LTVAQLEKLFNHSYRTLWWYIDKFLTKPPQPKLPLTQQTIWLKIDATYFGSSGCLVVYRIKGKVIYWRFVQGEYLDEYIRDLCYLKTAGYNIAGVTSDWHGSIVAAVRFALPTTPHQRCLVHTQRLVQSLLTCQPKTEAGQDLLTLSRFLNQIHNHYEARIWNLWLVRWKRRYEELIKQRSYATKDDGSKTWWYTHKSVRRAFRTLWFTQEHLFLYLNYPELDKDTNDLEALFSHLKQKLEAHRGLTRKKKIAFLYWYFHFKFR
jgi:hypothetical protein